MRSICLSPSCLAKPRKPACRVFYVSDIPRGSNPKGRERIDAMSIGHYGSERLKPTGTGGAERRMRSIRESPSCLAKPRKPACRVFYVSDIPRGSNPKGRERIDAMSIGHYGSERLKPTGTGGAERRMRSIRESPSCLAKTQETRLSGFLGF